MNRSILLGSVLMLACGSRSGLFDPLSSDSGVDSGLGGVGATGGLGATGGGGKGGVGALGGVGASGGLGGAGGSVDCNGLIQVQPILSVEHASSEFDSEPALTRSTDDGEQITVAFVRQPVESPASFAELRHASFHPWASWPPSGVLSPSYFTFAGPTLLKEFRVSPSSFDHFGLLAAHPTVVSFAPHVSANASDPGPNVTLPGATPVFVTEGGPDVHVLGTLSDQNELYVHVVKSGGGTFSTNIATVGCATTPIFGGAVPYENGWLIAYSNGQNAPATGVCGSPEGVGQPTRIDIAFVTNPLTTAFQGGLELPTPVIALSVAPYPTGMYIVWREASGGAVAPIRWARFDATQPGFVGPGEVSTPADYPLDFTATALGDRLAVAYGTDPAGNPPDIVLTVLDPWGSQLATTAFEPPFSGKLALIGSPSAHSLVVGFRGGGAAPSIELARFDCVP